MSSNHSESAGQAKSPKGNGAETPLVSPGSDRVTYEEMMEAIGKPAEGVTIGTVDIRYQCRKPSGKGEYFRTHPDHELWQDATVLLDEEGMDKSVYLVTLSMQPALSTWLKHVLLVPCVNADKEFFVWPITLADATLGQRSNPSEVAKRKAAKSAITTWTHLVWAGNQFVIKTAGGDLGEPTWPEKLDLRMINMRTFPDHFIRNRDHPIAKLYLGLAGRR
jgi:hypothetical protein